MFVMIIIILFKIIKRFIISLIMGTVTLHHLMIIAIAPYLLSDRLLGLPAIMAVLRLTSIGLKNSQPVSFIRVQMP